MAPSASVLLSFAALLGQTAALLIQQQVEKQSEKFCMASAVALDFEKNRVLDWVAYHHLRGVDCFALYFDRNHCNFSDPKVSAIFEELSRSDIVTLVNATYQTRPGDAAGPSLKEVSDLVGGARYLGVIDVDEFITTAEGVSLVDVLRDLVGSSGRLGLYLHRWSFGTNGYEEPVDVSKKPEFYYLTERTGDKHRMKPSRDEPRSGKMIFNVPTGVGLWGVHSWHQSNETPEAYMVLPDNTNLTTNPVQRYINRVHHVQPIWINHYMSGSLSECYDKANQGDHHRRRWMECKLLHPGGSEYNASSMHNDRELADAWGLSTRKHRDELFPGASLIYTPH